MSHVSCPLGGVYNTNHHEIFDRKEEIEILRQARERAAKSAQFVVVTGRRRIGKTRLVLQAFGEENILHFFVARKAENELCQGFAREIEDKLHIPQLGAPESFAKVFEYVMQIACRQPITLFIDEFQEFMRVNPSVFSDMQRIWDLYSTRALLTLVVAGSINALMNRIFRDAKEPLYNRQTRFLNLKPFAPSVLKEIMGCYRPGYTNDDLLALYTFTGGVPKYIDSLVTAGALSRQEMIDEIVGPASDIR